MLRKKMPKEPIKQTDSSKQTIQKPTFAAKPPSVSTLPPPAKVETKSIIIEKDKLNKEKIAEMVANNRIKQAKKQNEIVNKIATQMLSQNRKKFKEFPGQLKKALKLNESFRRGEDGEATLSKLIKTYGGQNFKPNAYI